MASGKDESQTQPGRSASDRDAPRSTERTVLKSLGLSGGIYGAVPCAVDVKDGKVVRIRPLHWDSKYDPETFNPWKITKNGKTLEPLYKAVPAPWGGESVRALVVSDGVEERLVHYWYQTPGRVISNVIGLKLQLTKNAIVRKPQQVVFVRLSTPLKNDYAGAEKRLSGHSTAVKEKIENLYRRRHETG